MAITSDHHAGSTIGLCPPRLLLDDGGEYLASKSQLWLWECWTAYWQQVEETRRANKAKLYAVFNGDLVDGNHHGTTQILSGNQNAQAAAVDAYLKIPLALKPNKLFFVRGTEAHAGPSASS